jgi:hypothetical protein
VSYPLGRSYPLGVEISVRPSILLSSRECSPPGVNKGVNISPRGHISPLGAKFPPWGQVHPWGPGVKLRMALSPGAVLVHVCPPEPDVVLLGVVSRMTDHEIFVIAIHQRLHFWSRFYETILVEIYG